MGWAHSYNEISKLGALSEEPGKRRLRAFAVENVPIQCVLLGPCEVGLSHRQCAAAEPPTQNDSRSLSLLPDNRISPQQMLSDFSTRKNGGAEGADFFHRWIDVVGFMRGPGSAGFAVRK